MRHSTKRQGGNGKAIWTIRIKLGLSLLHKQGVLTGPSPTALVLSLSITCFSCDLVGSRPSACAHFMCCRQAPPPLRFNFVRTCVILRSVALFFIKSFCRLLYTFTGCLACFRYRGFLTDILMSISLMRTKWWSHYLCILYLGSVCVDIQEALTEVPVVTTT